ncbi:conserved hypothetical protein (DUF4251) [Formosa agariphila KMM 3901]|uniref:DUF4251 domain-containing protein n=1 Tax=Formosa agariphila (strain DSM 15362 / KCTC 12365 / LMG 23005 / KMM 3901 / M-2Alg 35-1) TaxID=1347342 RepID=T2KJ37_FORAG|nr:DUF4251 domain-containing protein [Formosa agariphila]CDF78892.1 conserved hypothetical protein (DUF4251) [Formosa agariphila KMM 3901]
MKKHIILLVVLVFGMQLTFSQTKAEKKAAKKEKAEQNYTAIKKLIDTKQYTFEGSWATSQGGRRINLIGNTNFLNVDKDSTDAYLPYFGVAHIASYGGDGGIKFDGPYEDYKLSFNDKKQVVTVSYSTSHKSEKIDVTLRVFSPETASLVIYSSNRNSISYDGSIKALKKDEENEASN